MVKNPTYQCRKHEEHGFDPWVGKIAGGGNGNRGARGAAAHTVAESDVTERWSTRGHTHTQALILPTSFCFGHMMGVAHFSGVYHPLSPASRENTQKTPKQNHPNLSILPSG